MDTEGHTRITKETETQTTTHLGYAGKRKVRSPKHEETQGYCRIHRRQGKDTGICKDAFRYMGGQQAGSRKVKLSEEYVRIL